MIHFDKTQEILCTFLTETEEIFLNFLEESKYGGYTKIIPSIDLGFPHDVIRIAGGFATGAFVQWDSKIPIVPIDTCVNVCSTSFYELSNDLRDFFCQENIDKFNTLLEQGIYISNFHKGNHFISLLKSIKSNKFFLLMHSSAAEFKSNYNGLYPTLQSRFRKNVKVHQYSNRYIRYIDGKDAELFYKIASNLYEFNRIRHDFIADSIVNNKAKILNSKEFHHYGMPTFNSVVMGSHINKAGDVAPILTLPGKNIFMVKFNECICEDLFIPNSKEFLTPHGWGKNHNCQPQIFINYSDKLFKLDNESYKIEFGSSLRNHPNLQIREFSLNKGDVNYYFDYLEKSYKYEIIDEFMQIASINKLGIKIWYV